MKKLILVLVCVCIAVTLCFFVASYSAEPTETADISSTEGTVIIKSIENSDNVSDETEAVELEEVGDTLHLETENGTFLLVTEDGEGTGTYQVSDVGSSYELSDSTDAAVYWSASAEDNEAAADKIMITVYKENNVIGAALLTVGCEENVYTATLAKSANFPTVNSEYQNITEEYLEEFFEIEEQ
ncbi:MAG: hypothetical protein LUH54_03825 [Firmicutes bacterium]|nr:hypothetical protein [Bacillota bacterium]